MTTAEKAIICLFALTFGVGLILCWLEVKRIRFLNKLQCELRFSDKRQKVLQASLQNLWPEDGYVIHLCWRKEVEQFILLAQARTQVSSPEQVLYDAASLYIYLVERYSEGYRIILQNPPHAGILNWESLDRVKMKVES